MDRDNMQNINEEFTGELSKVYSRVVNPDIVRLIKDGLILEVKIKIPQEETLEVFEKYVGEGHEDIHLTMEIGKDPFIPFVIDVYYKGQNIEPTYDFNKLNYRSWVNRGDDETILNIIKQAIKQKTHKPIMNIDEEKVEIYTK